MKYANLYAGGLWLLAPLPQVATETDWLNLGEVVILAGVLLVIVRSIVPLINALVGAFKDMNESNRALVRLVEENNKTIASSTAASRIEAEALVKHTQALDGMKSKLDDTLTRLQVAQSSLGSDLKPVLADVREAARELRTFGEALVTVSQGLENRLSQMETRIIGALPKPDMSHFQQFPVPSEEKQNGQL
jgi:hypothetical protein